MVEHVGVIPLFSTSSNCCVELMLTIGFTNDVDAVVRFLVPDGNRKGNVLSVFRHKYMILIVRCTHVALSMNGS